MKFIDLDAQMEAMRPAIDRRIKSVLDHGKFIMGPEVRELESALTERVGVRHCLSCANGTDALQLALMALGVGPGDLVFTTAFSFFATAEVIALQGATPVFVDIDPGTYNLCPDALEAAILEAKGGNGRLAAIIAVDLFGLPADYPRLEAIARRHGLALIEDAAQGFGGAIGDRQAGSFGDIATTSFFPAKPLGCAGDGGAVFTNRDDLAERVASLRLHGRGAEKYDNVRIGMNSRLDTLQAAILLEKLTHLDQERAAKDAIAETCRARLAGRFQMQAEPTGFASAHALFTLRAPDNSRNALMASLEKAGIPCGIYYPRALPDQTAFNGTAHPPCIEARKAAMEVFSIPFHAYLAEENLNLILKKLIEAC
ncbi:DegT/DnrJ/EryC1/StrS family aminotransferase [Yunchengibacter salinarum]|uniref:DegT/DnrJ/EryC1/StrS family aminotransferase n=1 Tax=Yunchengibacter salinarum TaxID=3133399 RepID=UPI0035B5CA72